MEKKHGAGATAECIWTRHLVMNGGTGDYRCVNPFMHHGFDHVWELVSWHDNTEERH